MDISIQGLGAFGELIGAVAVVITLIYLSYQIKQNTVAVKAAAMESAFRSTSNVWRNSCSEFSRTEKMFEIAAKPAAERSPAERQYHLCSIMQTLRAQENMYFHMKLGTVDEGFIRLRTRLRSIFGHPQSLYRNAWNDGLVQPFISSEFQSFVENLLSETGNPLKVRNRRKSCRRPLSTRPRPRLTASRHKQQLVYRRLSRRGRLREWPDCRQSIRRASSRTA